MVNPRTVNVGIIVPLTGADVDTWGANDINPNMSAVDGLFGGVQTISVGAVPVTLTSPAGFAPTPGSGPVQSQNRVLRFTGVLSADVTVTLPLPGAYIIENLTTGNFVLSFRGITATEVVGTPQGERLEIYNDGANVRFVGMARVGAMEMWAGLSAMPAWVAACTVKPYLLCDTTVYNISDYVALGNRFLGKYGGNGITTFANPDMAGRVPLAYDSTGTRITAAGCGINGQTLGAANANAQSNTILTTNLPAYTPTGAIAVTNGAITIPKGNIIWSNGSGLAGGGAFGGVLSGNLPVTQAPSTATFTGVAQGGASTPMNNVQPAIVTGIWVVKT